jgi:predicted MFS family arabinose efflux permease
LVGTLSLASQKNFHHYNKIILVAEWVFGTALLTLSFVERLWLAIPLVSLAGMGIISFLVACNTILQLVVEEDKRGRVMSYYSMSMMVATPLGALAVGALADQIGAPHTMTVSAVCCLLAILLSSRRIWNLFPQ